LRKHVLSSQHVSRIVVSNIGGRDLGLEITPAAAAAKPSALVSFVLGPPAAMAPKRTREQQEKD